MNAKRRTEDFNLEIKKLRTIHDENTLPITCFENLSNEIYYEIFDYLDGCNIYKAFSNLNSRFQRLITCSAFPLKISLDEDSEPDLEHNCRHVIIPNKHRIISVHLRDSVLVKNFFTHCILDSSFNRLESIVFYRILSSNIVSIFSYLNSLPHLCALAINLDLDVDNSSIDLNEIYRLIFCLPSLKYNSLSLYGEGEITVLVPLDINQQSSPIESLIISYSCTLNDLISILHHTPRLRHLTCLDLVESDDNIQSEVTISIPHLTYLIVHNCCMEFDEFERFMKKICSRLQVSRIKRFGGANYIHPDQWQQLILKHMPHLVELNVKCLMNVDDTFEYLYLKTFVHQFTSRFWSDRDWNIKLAIEGDELFYSIYSNRKIWLNFDKNAESIGYSNQDLIQPIIRSTHFSSSHELSVTSSHFIEQLAPYIDQFSSILLAIQFTSLYVSNSTIPIGTFINIIRVLPNLDSLKVLSLPLQTWNNFSTDDVEGLRLISKSNKITKVWQSMDIELTQFLITLCPHMEYLEVARIEDMDLETLVRLILMKTTTHLIHLHSLRFHVQNGQDETVDDLQKLIDSKKLLFNYIIKRWANEIDLQWKLK